MRKKQQRIMVMSQAKGQEQPGLAMAFNIDILGEELAHQKAADYIAEQSRIFDKLEFSIKRGEW